MLRVRRRRGFSVLRQAALLVLLWLVRPFVPRWLAGLGRDAGALHMGGLRGAKDIIRRFVLSLQVLLLPEPR